MPSFSRTPQSSGSNDQRYEVVDMHNKPLMTMPWAAISKQGLRYRLAYLALRAPGNKSRGTTVFLQKKAGPAKGEVVLGLCSTPVAENESGLEAATRALLSEVALQTLIPVEKISFYPAHWVTAHCSLFTADMPGLLLPDNCNKDMFMQVDTDELGGLITSAPEKLRPEVLWAHSSGQLFT